MRSVMLIGLVIVLLIVGILVMKNMGVDSTGDVTETEARQVIQHAEDTKEDVRQKARNIQRRIQSSD